MPRKRRDEPSTAEILGSLVRGLLTVAGGVVFGASAGALAASALVSATVTSTPDNWGGAPALVVLMPIGGGIGLLVGLIAAISWIRNSEPRAYRVFDWLGLLLGGAAGAGLTLLVPDRYYVFMKCLIAAAIVPPCAALGRFVVGDLLSRLDRSPRL